MNFALSHRSGKRERKIIIEWTKYANNNLQVPLEKK